MASASISNFAELLDCKEDDPRLSENNNPNYQALVACVFAILRLQKPADADYLTYVRESQPFADAQALLAAWDE